MKVHYISPYVDASLISGYMTTPSARAKVEYIKDSLKEEGHLVTLFSPVRCKSSIFNICHSVKLDVDDLEKQIYPMSFGGDSLLSKFLSYLFVYFQLVWYIVFKISREDRIISYHSLPDTKIFKLFKPLIRARFILEVEELYHAVYGNKEKIASEKKLISNFADGYILVNTIIEGKCGITKHAVVCEGQYKMLSNKEKNLRDENNIVNMVYAGFLQKDSDVSLALKAVCLLDSSFVLHIAGYGDEDTVNSIKEDIENINRKNEGCKVVFHGCLFGEDYESLLGNCSLGLCSRILENELSDYTFPSKVFAYMSRNLRVICTPISCVQYSTIKDSIVFSKDVTPQGFAEAIMSSLSTGSVNNTTLVESENHRFKREIRHLLA